MNTIPVIKNGDENTSSQNKTDNEYISDFEDEVCFVELGCDVRVKVQTEYGSCFRVLKWTSEEKNGNLQIVNLQNDAKFVAEVYRIVSVSDRCNSSSMSNENDLAVKRQHCFDPSDNNSINIEWTVPIFPEFSDVLTCTFYDVFAWINKGVDWTYVPVKVKGKHVEFTCSQISNVTIICCPKWIRIVVEPSGCEVVTDCKIKIRFDEDTVKSRQSFKYSIQCPQNQETKTHERWLNASAKINFEYDKAQFVKPIKLIWELEEDNREVEVKCIGYKSNNPTLLETNIDIKDRNIYCGSIQGYDGVSFAVLKRTTDRKNETSIATKLKHELNLYYGVKILCDFLLFYHKRVLTTLHFTIDCIPKAYVDNILAKRKEDSLRFICSSKSIALTCHQRIRIRPTGSIGINPGQGSHFWLYFISNAQNNSLYFHVEMKKHLGGSPNAILELSTDNTKHMKISQLEFNLDSLLFPRKSNVQKRKVSSGTSPSPSKEDSSEQEIVEDKVFDGDIKVQTDHEPSSPDEIEKDIVSSCSPDFEIYENRQTGLSDRYEQ